MQKHKGTVDGKVVRAGKKLSMLKARVTSRIADDSDTDPQKRSVTEGGTVSGDPNKEAGRQEVEPNAPVHLRRKELAKVETTSSLTPHHLPKNRAKWRLKESSTKRPQSGQRRRTSQGKYHSVKAEQKRKE